jgi:ankyrin repeat protein
VDPLTGLTALAAAAEAGHKKILQNLLKHNARANIPTADGLKPIHLAARYP